MNLTTLGNDPKQDIELIRDRANTVFRAEHNPQTGAHLFPWVDVEYNATDFTASAGTWTVDAGDVVTFAYQRIGDSINLSIALVGTSLSTTPSELNIRIPFTAARQTHGFCWISDNGTARAGRFAILADTDLLVARRADAGAFASSANATTVVGSLTVSIA